MLMSMTGFGRAVSEVEGKKITIEIKSLNSKQLDLNVRTPSVYNEKETEIRSLISASLKRGKVFASLQVEFTGESSQYNLNHDLAASYFEEIKKLENTLGISESKDYLPVILRMPEVMKSQQSELDDAEWKAIRNGITEAIKNLDDFRAREGKVLEADFIKRIDLIRTLLKDIEPFEDGRVAKIREKMTKELSEIADNVKVDENRLEQELIFYVEKLDITEEKIRLNAHCDYFDDILKEKESNGKKLGFVAQEIGREINTIGSKANDVSIQKIVVNMKDELEKIKEQLMNIL